MNRANIVQRLTHARTETERMDVMDELITYDREKGRELMRLDPEEEKETTISLDFHGDFKDMNERVKDSIINPAHYKVIPAGNYPEGLEYMDLMNYILAHHKGIESHLVGQILKYSIRLGKKDAKQQDALKIQWYANYLVEVIKKQDER